MRVNRHRLARKEAIRIVYVFIELWGMRPQIFAYFKLKYTEILLQREWKITLTDFEIESNFRNMKMNNVDQKGNPVQI